MQILENNSRACISMQRCNMRVAAFHNSREGFIPESSRPELSKKNRCSCSALAALQKIQKWDRKADEAYAKTHGGRKSPVREENKCWEAVINLNSRHDMKDVKKLVKKLEQITGYRAAQIAIHRDEGHTNDDGNFIRNIHAHVIFYARDLKTGLSLSAANYGRKDLMRLMQDAVAEELQMERGRPAEETGKKHLSPRAYKAQKRQEAEWEAKLEKNNAEWQEKLAQNNKEWEQKKAEWEQKQAEREARQAEWEKKIPEIVAARERRSKYICDKLDWESARDGKKLAYEMQMLGISFAGVSNPSGNIIIEAQKDAIRNIFYMLGTTAQLAVFLMNKTLANDEKLAADAKIFNVESTLLRAVDYIANSDPANGEELKKRIRLTLMKIPADKQEELFAYAIENAPTDEIREDIKALVEGRFGDIAKSAAAQKRIENRDLQQALREYSAEVKRIREELKAMDEENRVLNLAERAILKEKGAGRAEYAEQEADNKARLEELKTLRQQVKDLNNDILNAKKQSELDKEKIAEQAAQIKELNEKIEELTDKNVKKQKELEAAKEEAEKDKIELKDKIEELEAEKIIPQDIFDEINRVHYGIEPETLHDMAIDERDAALDERDEALKRVKELENELKQQPKPEPEPIAKKVDDNLNIYGYQTYTPEPRRRFDYEPVRKIEPEPKQPEPEPFRDPWTEITDEMEKWKKCQSEVEKNIIKNSILKNIEAYEKNGVPAHRQMSLDGFRLALLPNLAADAEEIRKIRERELERKRQQAEIETSQKFEEVKKSVKQEADARQMRLKKKKEDYEMGMI